MTDHVNDDAEFEDVDLDLSLDEDDAAEDDVDINLDFGDDDDDEELDFSMLGDAEAEPTPADLGIDLSADADDTSDDDSDVALNLGVTPEAEADDEAAAEVETDTVDDAADLVEKRLEELREELRSKPGDWYVVHTYSGMEKRVKQNLEQRAQSLNMEDYIFEVRVPTEEVTEIRNGNKKNVTRTVLPGYVLVCMELTDESWATVRHTPSVTGFVGHATSPVPLSLEEVEKMLTPSVIAAANAEAAAAGKPKAGRKKKIEVADFAAGDSVMITDGPFAGVHASIVEVNGNSQRIKAMVEILGRETPVDLTFSQVEKTV